MTTGVGPKPNILHDPKSRSTGSIEQVANQDSVRRTSSAAVKGNLNCTLPRSAEQERRVKKIEQSIKENERDNWSSLDKVDERALGYFEGKRTVREVGSVRIFRRDWKV